MEYLTGKCVAALQGYEDEVWPTRFHPNIVMGHFVEAESGRKLMVASITHQARGPKCSPRPFLTIELCDFRSQ